MSAIAVGAALGLAWAAVAAGLAADALARLARRQPAVAGQGQREGHGRRVPRAADDRPGPVGCWRAPVAGLGAIVRRHAPGGRPSGDVVGRDHARDHTTAHDDARPDAGGAARHHDAPHRVAPHHAAPRDHPGHPGDPVADRRVGWSVIGGLALLAVAPPLAIAPVAWFVAAPALRARRQRSLDEARLADQLPDVVDLLSLTAAAGLPVGAALMALGGRPGGPLGAALARAAAHVRHGGSTAEALGLLLAAGPAVRPLVDALAQHDRYGSPLLPSLDRVAIETRARRRRRAEESARRLPVTLLLPLVVTTFPAFVLLTVVPLLAGSLGSLSLSPS